MELGVIGLGTMGASLARNAARRGARVAVYNRSPDRLRDFTDKHGHEGTFIPVTDYVQLKNALSTPRVILLMVTAGDATDAVCDALLPVLDAGDIVVDGGNSLYTDTEKRIKKMMQRGLPRASLFPHLVGSGIHFVGMGVSGGEEGALFGPSMMPGDPATWARCAPLLNPMAADDGAGGKCVTFCGPAGAGHFVKMTHNGIEYAIMQSLAEAYDVLRKVGGLSPPQLHDVFADWNAEGSLLRSFLVEISMHIFTVRDTHSENFLIDMIRPHAEQKGTGHWTVEASLKYAAPAPTITASLLARTLSGAADLRAHGFVPQKASSQGGVVPVDLVAKVRAALELCVTASYIQGFEILKAAGAAEHWNLPMAEIARIWRGGCIIRSALLPLFQNAFTASQNRDWLGPDIKTIFSPDRLRHLRELVAMCSLRGIPCMAHSATLGYLDSIAEPNLPLNLVQAQRDCFGAHTYARIDRPPQEKFHSVWAPSSDQ